MFEKLKSTFGNVFGFLIVFGLCFVMIWSDRATIARLFDAAISLKLGTIISLLFVGCYLAILPGLVREKMNKRKM